MSDASETFFTSVGCMDGRAQDPVANFGGEKFGTEFADTITEIGLVGVLANNPSLTLLEGLKTKLDVSIDKHHSKGVIVHGHQECAGNPVSSEKHVEDIKKSVEVIKGLVNNRVPVIGVFVKRSLENPKIWEVEEV